MLSDFGRRICKRTRVGTNKKCAAELIVNGNQIEFYAQDNGNAAPDVFIGGDIEHKYKVVTNGLKADTTAFSPNYAPHASSTVISL